uniref:Uncharacterized protein n=1 Tax=Cuerna arida TaxID=1464854 RepID=A0A1B6GL36_9HEMI
MANQVFDISVTVIYTLILFTLHSVMCKDLIKKAEEFKALDDEIVECIHNPATLNSWDNLLVTMDFYLKSLNNVVEEILSNTRETIHSEAEKIWNGQMPKFITQVLDETMCSIVMPITPNQIDKFYKKQELAEKQWNKFSDLVKTKYRLKVL